MSEPFSEIKGLDPDFFSEKRNNLIAGLKRRFSGLNTNSLLFMDLILFLKLKIMIKIIIHQLK